MSQSPSTGAAPEVTAPQWAPALSAVPLRPCYPHLGGTVLAGNFPWTEMFSLHPAPFTPCGCYSVAQVHEIMHVAGGGAQLSLAGPTAGSCSNMHQRIPGQDQRYPNLYPRLSGWRQLQPQNTGEESLELSFEYITFDQLQTTD